MDEELKRMEEAVEEATEGACNEEETQEERDTAAEAVMADLREFATLFPEAAAHPEAIPQEVWAAVREGHSLTGAWSRWALDQKPQKEKRLPFPSTGSMRSQGFGPKKRDPFLEGWGK